LKIFLAYNSTFFITILTVILSQSAQSQTEIESSIRSSSFIIENFEISYYSIFNDSDYYSLDLDKLKFGFSNINFKSWKDNSTLQPKLEFIGPKVSVENLILKAEVYRPNWIINEKLKRLYSRQSIPRLGIIEIDKAIILYNTDNGQHPSSINDLIVKNYIDLGKKPFNNSLWNYSMDLPKRIFARPSKGNPIPETKVISYDFTQKEFLLDPLIDSLKKTPMIKWIYNFEIDSVSASSSSELNIKHNKNYSDFSLMMEQGNFRINNIRFTALPQNKIKDKTFIGLRELSISSKNLTINGEYDSTLIFHNGEGQFKIDDFELKIPEDLGKEPEIERFLSQIGVRNNSLSIRSVELGIKMLNQFTGNLFFEVSTPFIKANFNGNLSFRQKNIKTSEIKFHNAELIIRPIALGIKKWIRNWESSKKITLKRKGPAIIIKLNGSLNSLDLQALKNITIF
tara:strand:- start:1554 stop:2918 length:1365 start_codon:yes stop_codon:yes gene_type:complete